MKRKTNAILWNREYVKDVKWEVDNCKAEIIMFV